SSISPPISISILFPYTTLFRSYISRFKRYFRLAIAYIDNIYHKMYVVYVNKGVIKMNQSFKAVVVDKNEDEVNYGIQDITVDDLSEGEVLIKVAYSSV